MQTQPRFSDLAPPPTRQAAVEAADDVTYFKRVLRHFVEIGDEFAGMLHQEARQSAQAQTEAAKRHPDPQMAAPIVLPPGITDAYERITRSVRRSMVMYQKLDQPPKAPPLDRVAARKRIIRDVEDAIHAKASGAHAETLRAELVERLERPEFDDELANRSVADLVTEICRDLGLPARQPLLPGKRRTPHDIAILHARAAQHPAHPDDS